MQKTALFRKLRGVTPEKCGAYGFLCDLDALAFLHSVRDEVADLVFVDPPFNLGKNYGPLAALEEHDPLSYEWYMQNMLREAVRIMKPGAALFVYHVPYWATRLSGILNNHLQFRHWIAVAMKNGFVRGNRLYPAHYALLYYTKGEPAHFSRPKLEPLKCRRCQTVLKDYGGYRDIVFQNGLNLSDFWDDLSPVRHGSRKHRQANELPERLTDRVVAIAGTAGGVLVDPFVGTGTSLVSARRAEMLFIGNDIERGNLDICRQRLEIEGAVPDHTCE